MGWTKGENCFDSGQRQHIFLHPKIFAHATSSSKGTGGFSSRAQRLEFEVDHWAKLIVEVNREWSYTSTPPYAFLACTGTTVLFLLLPAYWRTSECRRHDRVNPLNAELNPICYLLALLGAHHFLHVSRIRVKSLTLKLLMSYIYIYGAPILDVSRSHTTTQHSR